MLKLNHLWHKTHKPLPMFPHSHFPNVQSPIKTLSLKSYFNSILIDNRLIGLSAISEINLLPD